MRNFQLTLEYDGTNYNGWQTQATNQKKKGGTVRTIQTVLGEALFRLFTKRVKLNSSGRTDSGVHAEAQVVNFKVRTELKPPRIKKALNSLLPPDIRVKKVKIVSTDFNAQHDALSKTYRYVICNKDYVPAFARHYVYHFTYPLNIYLMRKEAKVLLGTHDFSAFKSSGGETTDCKRRIKRIKIKKKEEFIEIEIEADGFLYNMVRNIVGTLLEIARGKFPPGSMKRILQSRDRKTAGPTVPAKGLSLVSVKY